MIAPRTGMAPLSWFAQANGVELIGDDAEVLRVNSDSRAVQGGDLFVALRGERFDGHSFSQGAADAGAVGMGCDRRLDTAIAQIVVNDTLSALQTVAQAWRRRFDIPVIGVTGSNGKTTTKQMLAAVLSARGPVLATRGNLNNHIGMPMTLLELREEHRTAVIEMGANHAGEVELLTTLAAPNIGLVTQAGDAHLEGFGSRDGVAHAKGELFAGLGEDGIAIINADDAYADLWRSMARCSQLSFGIDNAADVRACDIRCEHDSSRFTLEIPGGEAQVEMALAGRHNIMNALAAAACAAALGLEAHSIADGLGRFEQAQGRLVWRKATSGAQVIDDSYNANPTSLRAGLELLAQQEGRRYAVLGGMGELGPDSDSLHEWCGAKARELGIEHLYALGNSARHYVNGFGSGGVAFDSVEELTARLQAESGTQTTMLVKGSRSARMERIVTALCGDAAAGH